jgi:bla regulator protein blaR1
MITALVNHLWQSTVFAAAAGLLTVVLRNNHARARYWIWLAASLKFLVPFKLLVRLGGHLSWHRSFAQAPVAFAIGQFGQPFAPVRHALALRIPASAVPNLSSLIPILLITVWLGGCAVVLFAWWTRWRRIKSTVRAAVPLEEGRAVDALRRLGQIQIVSSTSAIEPGIFGILRPVLLWPAHITERLTDAQLDAILAHEISHVRRRDNLAAAIHMLVEAVFWFHPLVWWIGARLVAERETACDQDVLGFECEPEVYAQGILKVCEYYLEAPLLCVSGVAGSDLKKRIEGIMAHRIGRDLGLARKLLLAVAGIAAIAVPIGIGLVNSSAGQDQPQAAAAPLPEFEAVSIKPNKSGKDPSRFHPARGGRLTATNVTLRALIQWAYGIRDFQLSGEPGWADTERYDVAAKADGNPRFDFLQPTFETMFRSVLADRFKLAVHHQTKELPIYSLVVAKNGPKIHPVDEGDCPEVPTPENPCRSLRRTNFAELTGVKAPIGALALMIGVTADTTVIDKTGLKGSYSYKLNWTPDLPPPPPPGPDNQTVRVPFDPASFAPAISTALQDQLGLKLESGKGPVDILVIDHVERPSEN